MKPKHAYLNTCGPRRTASTWFARPIYTDGRDDVHAKRLPNGQRGRNMRTSEVEVRVNQLPPGTCLGCVIGNNCCQRRTVSAQPVRPESADTSCSAPYLLVGMGVPSVPEKWNNNPSPVPVPEKWNNNPSPVPEKWNNNPSPVPVPRSTPFPVPPRSPFQPRSMCGRQKLAPPHAFHADVQELTIMCDRASHAACLPIITSVCAPTKGTPLGCALLLVCGAQDASDCGRVCPLV